MSARTRVRAWRWRRNALRRRSDVLAAWVHLLLAVVLLVGVPLAGTLVGRHTFERAEARAEQRRSAVRAVRAMLTEDAPQPVPGALGAAGRRVHPVLVRWTDASGVTRTDVADVAAGARKGDTTRIWLDSRGRAVPAPPGAEELWTTAIAAGSCAALGVCVLVLGTGTLVHHVALRRRMAEWERAWAAVGPLWGRRRTDP